MFWDYSKNSGAGDWSDTGCKFHAIHYNKSMTTSIKNPACHIDAPEEQAIVLDECWCYHLTHFGELFQDHDMCVPQDPALDSISLWGSIIGLICIALIFSTIALNPKLIRQPGQKTKLQITLNFAILLVLFILGSQLTELSMPKKVTLGILIHYSMLCNFAWMLIAAMLQYKRLVIVFTSESSKDRFKYALIGWAFPIIPPMLVLATGNYEAYSYPPLYIPRGLPFYLSIVLPLFLVMSYNVVIFVLIARSLYMEKIIRTHGDQCMSIARFKQLVFLFTLLGLSWLLALCQILVKENLVLLFSYLFCICISLQGPAYFVFFVLMDKNARNSWRKYCCKWTRKDESTIMAMSESSNNGKSANTLDSK
jgi:hypothetical protein